MFKRTSYFEIQFQGLNQTVSAKFNVSSDNVDLAIEKLLGAFSLLKQIDDGKITDFEREV